MENGSTGAGNLAAVVVTTRPDLYEDYVRSCMEEGWCRGQELLRSASQYLRKDDPIPAHTFTLFPFHQALSGAPGPPPPPSSALELRRHLSGLIRATELLETICVNLFLQPWRKEFRSLKTFTGPFVYFLLPVLGSSTVQSVLASIGYLPHSATEFRLREDAQTNTSSVLGLELLLARLEYLNLLELLEKDQLGPQQWLEVVRGRTGSSTTEEPGTKKRPEQREEEKKTPFCRPAKGPPPHSCLPSPDQSIMEMQRTYPDLAIRGRPLLPDKPKPTSRSKKPDSQPQDLKPSSSSMSASESHRDQPQDKLHQEEDDEDDDDDIFESSSSLTESDEEMSCHNAKKYHLRARLKVFAEQEQGNHGNINSGLDPGHSKEISKTIP